MRSGALAAGVTLLLLAAACTSGPGEGVTELVTTTADTSQTDTGEATETRPQLPSVNAGPPAQGGPLDLKLVASGLRSPVFATGAPGVEGKLFVVEQAGRIRVLERGKLLDEPFLDITEKVASGGEQGLLSVAFHPNYRRNRRFYVNYTDNNGHTRVVEYRSNGTRALPGTARQLLFVRQPYANHNGGQLAFGPDGYLYVGMGDGGAGGDPENRAQNLNDRLGKLLRQGRIKRGISSYFTSNPEAVAAVNDGEMDATLVPQGTFAEAIRAAGAGIAGFLTPVGVGTVLAEGKEEHVVDGVPHVLERPIHADVALVYAARGDELGNLWYRRTARNFNPLMATAARVTVAEAGEVLEVGELEPEAIHTPHLYVDVLVERP